MHYAANETVAFGSVEHIMRDVNWGWLLRYAHSNGASAFFVVIYIHIFAVSTMAPTSAREMVWLLGRRHLPLLDGYGVHGLCAALGQMSFWGAQVITGLFSADPVDGNALHEWLLADLHLAMPRHRFFSLHYFCPSWVVGSGRAPHLALHIPGFVQPTVSR